MKAVLVDNTSPDIRYSTGWHDGPRHVTDYNQTVAYSDVPGSRFHFTFTGTSVAVLGCIKPNTSSLATYTLDNLPPVRYMGPHSDQYASTRLFYGSPNVPNGRHTLVVTAMDASYCFDYLLYNPGANPLSPTAIVMHMVSPGVDGPYQRLSIFLPLSCIIALVTLLSAIFLVRRRRRARRRQAESEIPYVPNIPYKPTGLPAVPEKAKPIDGKPPIIYPAPTYSSEAPPAYLP